MSEKEPLPKALKTRTRKALPRRVQLPVEVTLWRPGEKAPRTFGALWVRREQGSVIFGLPEFERPYMQRTLRVPDSSGVTIEVAELVYQQQAPQPQPQQQAFPELPQRPMSAGGPGATLRLENPAMQVTPIAQPLRSTIGGGQAASEVRDENGNLVVVPAAFGMAVV